MSRELNHALALNGKVIHVKDIDEPKMLLTTSAASIRKDPATAVLRMLFYLLIFLFSLSSFPFPPKSRLSESSQ